jgi:hypothetical protein
MYKIQDEKMGVDKSVWSNNYKRFQKDLTTIFLIICLKK